MCDAVAKNQYFYCLASVPYQLIAKGNSCPCNIWAATADDHVCQCVFVCECEGIVPAVAAAEGLPTLSGLDRAVV